MCYRIAARDRCGMVKKALFKAAAYRQSSQLGVIRPDRLLPNPMFIKFSSGLECEWFSRWHESIASPQTQLIGNVITQARTYDGLRKLIGIITEAPLSFHPPSEFF